MLKEKIEKIKKLVEACNQLADERVFTYKVTETTENRFFIKVECKNHVYRNELRTLITLIDILNPVTESGDDFADLY